MSVSSGSKSCPGPKLILQLYLGLSVIYLALGLGWGFLCFKHFRELL
jgi:hypothetical protein